MKNLVQISRGITTQFAILLIIFVTLVTYANSLQNSFVGDDFIVIVDNNFVKDWNNFPLIFTKNYLTSDSELSHIKQPGSGSGEASYRPLVTISYFLDHQLWKLNAFGYHLTNLLLHITNSLLLFLFINLIVSNKKISLLTALLFALHPVNNEVVNVISFREDLLVFMFFMLSFTFFIKAKQIKQKKFLFYTLSILSFALSLLSKEMALTLPIMLCFYDYIFRAEKKDRRLSDFINLRHAGYIILSSAYLLFFLNIMKEFSLKYSSGNLYVKLFKMVYAFTTYIQWIFIPVNVHFAFVLSDKAIPVSTSSLIPRTLLVALLTILSLVLIKKKNKSKELSFGIGWFFITLLPVSNILPMQNFMAARYLYIPIVGFCFLIALGLDKLSKTNIFFADGTKRNTFTAGIIFFLLFFYSTFTFAQNLSFRNNTVFWQKIVDDYPDNSVAHLSLGLWFMENDLLDEDTFRELKKAMDLAPKQSKSKYHYSLGHFYLKKKMLLEAEKEFKEALKSANYPPSTFFFLAMVLGDEKKYEEAENYFKKAIKLNAAHLDAYNNLGIIYARTKQWTKAKKCWEKTLEINPEYEDAKKNLEKLISQSQSI